MDGETCTVAVADSIRMARRGNTERDVSDDSAELSAGFNHQIESAIAELRVRKTSA
jgi:hypothetical protein